MKNERLISDGRCRLLMDPATRERIGQVTAEIKDQLRRDMAEAGLLGKMKLLFRMKRAVRAAKEKIAPSSGCYLKT